jgi:putative membrane protein
MLFTDNDRDRIGSAIAGAEAQTAGEIVVIVATEPQRYPATALSVAMIGALAVPLAAVFAGWSPGDLFPDWDAIDPTTRALRGFEAFTLVETLIFVAVLALVHFTPLARRLTPKGLRRDRVHRAALTQFKARGLDATGVLIYIDEPEHIAEIIADTAVYAKVDPGHWGATITALTAGIKAGRPADGMVAAIGLAGDVLAAHFPPVENDINELPDHLIEL